MAKRYLFPTLLALAVSDIASAEVSDKIPSVPGYWAQGLILGALVVLAARFRWWLGAILLLVPIVFLAGSIEMYTDPFLAPAIVKEQGQGYFVNVFAADSASLILSGLGVWYGFQRQRHEDSGGAA